VDCKCKIKFNFLCHEMIAFQNEIIEIL